MLNNVICACNAYNIIDILTLSDCVKAGDIIKNTENIYDDKDYEILCTVDDLTAFEYNQVWQIIKTLRAERDAIDLLRQKVISKNYDRRNFLKDEMEYIKKYIDAKTAISNIYNNSKSDIKGVTIHTTSDMISTIVDDFFKDLMEEEHR